ncbi:hypothetical protein [Bacillus cereus]
MKPIQMHYRANHDEIPEAYEFLLNDALCGDSTYFAHWDEVELSWKWIKPIIEAFEENQLPLYFYEAGSYGPKAADGVLLIAKIGELFDIHQLDTQIIAAGSVAKFFNCKLDEKLFTNHYTTINNFCNSLHIEKQKPGLRLLFFLYRA